MPPASLPPLVLTHSPALVLCVHLLNPSSPQSPFPLFFSLHLLVGFQTLLFDLRMSGNQEGSADKPASSASVCKL